MAAKVRKTRLNVHARIKTVLVMVIFNELLASRLSSYPIPS